MLHMYIVSKMFVCFFSYEKTCLRLFSQLIFHLALYCGYTLNYSFDMECHPLYQWKINTYILDVVKK